MDINMKNIILEKDGEWIYIKDGEKKTKLLYDPRNENDINLIQQQLTQMNEYNMWDLADDYAGTADWVLTLRSGFSFSKKISVDQATEVGKTFETIGYNLIGSLFIDDGSSAEEEIAAGLTTFARDVSLKTAKLEDIESTAGDIAAVYWPSYNALSKKIGAKDKATALLALKDGVDFTEAEKNSTKLTEEEKARIAAGIPKYTDNELRVLEQQIRDQNTYNAWDLEDDVAGTADYMMTPRRDI